MSILRRSQNLLKTSYPLWLGGKPVWETGHSQSVLDKFSGEEVAVVAAGDVDIANKAFDLAHSACERMAELPSYERKR